MKKKSQKKHGSVTEGRGSTSQEKSPKRECPGRKRKLKKETLNLSSST